MKRFAALLCLLLGATLASHIMAAPSDAKKAELKQIWDTLVEAGGLYKQGQGEQAANLVRKAQSAYDSFTAPPDAQTQQLLDRIYGALANAHTAMQLDGIRLGKLNRNVLAKGKPQLTPENAPEPPALGDAISFAGHVAPLLLAKCGRCHVMDAKGGFNLGTYAGLMRGSRDGKVVFAGDAVGSRLIEVIETGDMPRGGGSVAAAELSMLKKWIEQGAKDDGPSPDTPLARLTPNSRPEEAPKTPTVDIVKAGAEGPSFGRDVAGVLAKNCTGCHGTNNPRNNFSLASFDRLLRGGDSGPPIVPGKPAASLLIKKLRGQAGARMPLNLPALSEETIAGIEAWIGAGAKFDGPSTTAPVERVAAFVKASLASHEELSDERGEIAKSNWKLALPGIESRSDSTDNFLLLGNVDDATLKKLGETAEQIAPQVAKIFGAPADQPLVKGRMTLFAFPQRYDYSEFGQMVEKRKLPQQWYGHWNYDGVDAYGCLVPSRTEKYSSKALIAQQLGGVYVAAAGDVPRWFAEGAGRVVASRIAADDPRVKAWDEELSAALGSMTAADDFQTGKLADELAMVASYSFAKFLMKDSRRFQKLLGELRDGQEFAAAFASAYGGSPAQLAQAWARGAARRL